MGKGRLQGGLHTRRERKIERKKRERERGTKEEARVWEKGGNGARYGEMARKLGIVTGNGRPPTLL